jgi:arylsulfatase A-like enzyme
VIAAHPATAAPRTRRPRAALCVALLLLLPSAACSRRPNIVFVVADDHGYPYAGFSGSELVQTPNLDALAAEGTRFTRAFTTASSCRPSQRTLLTGLYPQQWMATVRALPPRHDERHGWSQVRHFATLPGLLGAHGYATFQGGKLWEGRTFQDAGFGAGTKDPVPERPSRDELSGGSGLRLGRETMEPLWGFVDAHAQGPFFVFFAPTLPHAPLDPPPEFEEPYARAPISEAARLYFANVSRLDAVVGELLRGLAARGLQEDTVVVYLSDNGWEQDPQREAADGGEHGKHSIRELGFHTPLIVRWPGVVPAGAVREDLVSTVDLFPTLLQMARVDVPAGRMGVSLLPTLLYGIPSPRTRVIAGVNQLRGPTPRRGRPREIAAQAHFVRTPEWRYVSYDTYGREELYHLPSDPDERHDVAGEKSEELAALRARLEDWKEHVGHPLEDETPAGESQSGV